MDISSQTKINTKTKFNKKMVLLTAIDGDIRYVDIDPTTGFAGGSTWNLREADSTVSVASVDDNENFTLTTAGDADDLRIGETLEVKNGATSVGHITITAINAGVITFNYPGTQGVDSDYTPLATFDTLVLEEDPILQEGKCKLIDTRVRNMFICKGTTLSHSLLQQGNIL